MTMKKEHTSTYQIILENLRKIMIDKKLTQLALAEMMGTSESGVSKILSGQATLTIDHLANLASELSLPMTEFLLDASAPPSQEPIEAILQIKLKKEKKDQVLKLVFGENNIEILNK